MLIAVTSARGAPGVTTAALALTLSWPRPRRAVLAELDPAGGEVLAGYGGGQLAAPGLGELIFAARRGGGLGPQLWSHLVQLNTGGRALLLPGLADPAAARGVGWDRLAAALADLDGDGTDVLADCGRLRAEWFPEPALRRAAAVVVVCGSSLRAVRAAKQAVAELRGGPLTDVAAGGEGLCLLVAGPDGPYSEREIAAAVGVPVLGVLPRDAKASAVLSDGAPASRSWQQSRLMRAAGTVAADLSVFAAGRRDRLTPGAESTAAAAGGGGRGR